MAAFTKISRKQAGVLYRNMKEGVLAIPSDLVSFMYDRADKTYSWDAVDDAVEAQLLKAVDLVFAQDIAGAQEQIDGAFVLYAAQHGLVPAVDDAVEESEEIPEDETVTETIDVDVVASFVEVTETAASYELQRNVDEPDYYPRAKVAELVADGEIVGGENGEEDIIQIAKDGVLWQVFCDTHWDDIPEDLDEITEHAVGLTCDFSVGRWNAPKVVEHPYTFAHYNGNVGEDVGFDTLEEAEKAARDKWAHLTDSEKARYSKPGSYFIVAEGDTTDGYNDVLDLTEEDESRIDEWTGTLKVKGHGNSLILTITEAVRLMGLSLGDVVEVQIRRR